MCPFADPLQPVSKLLDGYCDLPIQPGDPHRAVARNLLAEHRLSADRFKGFTAFAGDMPAFEQVHLALERYQTDQVRPLSGAGIEPAYERDDNAENRITLGKGMHVGTVLNLTRLDNVYREGWSTFRIPQFEKYVQTSPRGAEQVNDFLNDRLTDAAQREPFLEAILLALSRFRKSKRIAAQRVRPTWVAEWDSLRPFLEPDKPERWLQAVGVPSDDPAWVAVFRYPVWRRGKPMILYRPTQLDAGWYAHHFPSPPAAPLESGGYAMYLRQHSEPPSEPSGWIREYLHRQIDFSIEQWRDAGSLLRMVRRVGGALDDQRRHHWQRLQEKYGTPQILGWMASCP